MNGLESALILRELSVRTNGRTVLESLSLSVEKGSWLSIVGPNGAGKSTLLKAIAGLTESGAAELRLGNTDLRRLPVRERAARVSYVPQRFEALVPFEVSEFLAFALYAGGFAGSERISEAIEIFRLEQFRSRSIQQLSVGELQRVMIAAAFVQGGDILLLDEPSSALDPYEESQMIAALNTLIKKQMRTVLFVSHNLSAALSFADRVLVLDHGRAVMRGTPEEIIRSTALERVFRQRFFIEQRSGQIDVTPDYRSTTVTETGI